MTEWWALCLGALWLWKSLRSIPEQQLLGRVASLSLAIFHFIFSVALQTLKVRKVEPLEQRFLPPSCPLCSSSRADEGKYKSLEPGCPGGAFPQRLPDRVTSAVLATCAWKGCTRIGLMLCCRHLEIFHNF